MLTPTCDFIKGKTNCYVTVFSWTLHSRVVEIREMYFIYKHYSSHDKIASHEEGRFKEIGKQIGLNVRRVT